MAAIIHTNVGVPLGATWLFVMQFAIELLKKEGGKK